MAKNTDNQFTQISRSITVKGDLIGEGDLRIAGTVIGNLSSNGNVIVENSGFMEGEFKVSSATIAGKIKGNIECTNKLILESNSQFIGNIKTKQLIIEEGASFNGNCEMIPDKPENKDPLL